ncbi:DNA mismatch repair protein Msh6 [Orchesella cincta]|uniref:DNA mismatch repair protein n=1 Tax=Orchesella cincta TaxID=48709 RepID=A0A1D2MNY6_ORCCI|nr:DNA mismatch repair protein Msh6 [Orchesella cincta]
MQKQTTLFSFFSRTPKSATSSPSSSTSKSQTNGSSTPPGGDGDDNVSMSGETPSKSLVSTPVSRTGGEKRRRTSGGQSAELGGSRKKVKNEDSPSKEYSEGTLVWAKLEGYPWWPAMIRGETHGGAYSRKSAVEFHVQFFDDPPSRAWIRKGDLKIYRGSQDADIPPARSDRAWLSACKIADDALALKTEKRLEKHWIEFTPSEEENNGNCSAESEEEEEPKTETERMETPKSRSSRREVKKHKRVLTIASSSEDEESEVVSKSSKKLNTSNLKKPRKEEDEDDYSPTKNGSLEEESESSESLVESEKMSEVESGTDHDEDDTPKKTPKRSAPKAKQKLSATPNRGSPVVSKVDMKGRLQQFNIKDTPNSSLSSPKPESNKGIEESDALWEHMRLTWAQDGKRMDANRRKQTHPDYDPRTLYVPPEYFNSKSPAMRQWWEMKSKHFDTILFFKVGKFYEFYHWDACTAVQELSITFMKGDYAHSGFPEISFSRFANTLMEKGYKVARIEQTETPAMLEKRVKTSKPAKHEKVIKREICQIATKGVRYASFQDDSSSSPFTPESAYLYAIVEKSSSSTAEGSSFGVCFIDTTIGTFHIGEFEDDRHASRLRTLFSHFTPVQILHERGKLSSCLQQLLQNMSSVRKDPLLPDTEFWGAKKTLKFLAEEYFRDKEAGGAPQWPPEFQAVLSKSDGLGLTPDEDWELGVRSLGAVVWYLKDCLLDHDLLSQKKFEVYKPADISSNATVPSLPERLKRSKYMILDGVTLRNLEILEGPLSLLSTLDKCGTNFGKRLLRHWVCLPLAIPADICDRQDAIEELMCIRERRDKVVPLLKSLPDLERLLTKTHYLGSAYRSKNHPDGRAIFFNEINYSKNKINDLITVLKGFKTCVKIIKEFKNAKDEDEIKSSLITRVIEGFPSLDKLLTYFDNAFDHQAASKEGKIKPRPGADEQFDNARQTVAEIQSEADEYLKDISRQLKARAVYFGSDKKRFQIEVPDYVKVSKEFEMSSGRKGFKRYYNAKTKGFLASIMEAETEREEILRDITRRIFAQFDKDRETWSRAVECIATLDVLISLAIYSESQDLMCRPTLSYSSLPFLNIVEGRHPCVASDSYIPNDTKMGVEIEDETPKGNFVILTGPNMGGKSTLMRQVGLLTILSQLGCHVPAEKCELSVVDRVFTRLGANDNIGEGESTFFVEMSETSAILKHATPSSLLLIDELGRGTATYDGTAIAYAVAKELSERKCRSFFSTHYHTLVEALQDMPLIQMSHMACMVENENEDDPTQESITFLYKMISGPCPKSYGFNAARLAGINDDVIRVAYKKAKELESVVNGIRSFTAICTGIQEKKFSMKDFAALKI